MGFHSFNKWLAGIMAMTIAGLIVLYIEVTYIKEKISAPNTNVVAHDYLGFSHLKVILFDGTKTRIYRGNTPYPVSLPALILSTRAFDPELALHLTCELKYTAVPGLEINETNDCVFEVSAKKIGSDTSEKISYVSLRVCNSNTRSCINGKKEILVYGG